MRGQWRAHTEVLGGKDKALAEIKRIQSEARQNPDAERPQWPMIILRSPKGWTGPKIVDGLQIEGMFRSHQVPVTDLEKPEHLKMLEQWMLSYKPEELFDGNGKFLSKLASLAPKGNRRMGANPVAPYRIVLTAAMDARLPAPS